MKTHPVKVAIITDDKSNSTFAGREVQTSLGPVVGIPSEAKKGDRIKTQYQSSSSYGLVFFKGFVKNGKL